MKWFTPKMATQDFTNDSMPHDRRGVFKDVVKLHHRTLLICGLILFACMLPLHLTALWEAVFQANLSSTLGKSPTSEQAMEAMLTMISFSNTRGLIDILGWVVFFIGFAGVARVIRQYAWEENVYFRYEFVVGIKTNWKQYTFLAVIVGVLSFVCTYIRNLSTMAETTGQGEIYSYLGLLPTVLFLIFLLPPAMYAVVCMTVYNNSFRQNIKIGFALYAKRLFKTVLAVACCAIIFVPQLIPNIICIIIGRMLSSLILPFILLGWWLFTFNGLDEAINPKYAPELIGRGVTPMSEELIAEIERKKKLDEEQKYRIKRQKANKKAANKRKNR